VAPIYQLKISLRGAKPPIWRRIQVEARTTLADLHPIILVTMGWYGGHLYVFRVGDRLYGYPDPELGFTDARRLTLAGAVRTGMPLVHEYDFGDGWEHLITVEKELPAEKGVTYPRCLTGRRACPPEDCGGIWAYQELLEVLADPEHPDREQAEETMLGRDPASFEVDRVNERLKDPMSHVFLAEDFL
jgi:hypothetical protein